MAKLNLLENLDVKEQSIEEQIKELQEKIQTAKKMKDSVSSERKALELELKKLPPVLAKGLKNIEEKQAELSKLQEELSALKEGWIEEAKKSKLSEDFISKLIKNKGAPKTGNGGAKKVEPAEKQEAILKAVKDWLNSISLIQNAVGQSKNTRDNLQILVDSGKLKKDEAGIYSLP